MDTSYDGQLPLLILIRGLPGSGKTYVAEALRNSLGRERVVMLDPDLIDRESEAYHDFTKALAQEGVDRKFHPYRFVRAQAHAGIESGKIIIWNQPFTHLDGFNKTVANLAGYATEHHIDLPMLLVEVEIDPVQAKERVVVRKHAGGHGPSDDTFERFVNDYISFSDQGLKTVIVSGGDDVAISVDKIRKALHQLTDR